MYQVLYFSLVKTKQSECCFVNITKSRKTNETFDLEFILVFFCLLCIYKNNLPHFSYNLKCCCLYWIKRHTQQCRQCIKKKLNEFSSNFMTKYLF